VSDPEAKLDTSHESKPTDVPPVPAQGPHNGAMNEQTEAEAPKKQRCRKFHKAPVWIEECAAIALVFITTFYTHYASIQADQATKTAKAAKSAADTAARQLEMSERPWMAAYFSVKEPLVFDSGGVMAVNV
jgi:hypothetical protein